MYVYVWDPACVYVQQLCAGARRGQKSASGLLALGLQEVVRHRMDAGTSAHPLCKDTQCCQLLSQVSSPSLGHFHRYTHSAFLLSLLPFLPSLLPVPFPPAHPSTPSGDIDSTCKRKHDLPFCPLLPSCSLLTAPFPLDPFLSPYIPPPPFPMHTHIHTSIHICICVFCRRKKTDFSESEFCLA